MNNEPKKNFEDADWNLLKDVNLKLETLIELQEQNQKHNGATEEALTDDIVRAVWNIAVNVATIKSIALFMFVLVVVSNVVAILALASGLH